MADDNIQRPPDSLHPTAPAAATDDRVTAPPPPAPRPAAAPATTPSVGWLSRYGKCLVVAVAAGAVAALVLKFGLDLTATQVAVLSAIVAVAVGVFSRGWLAPAPARARAPGEPETRSDISNTREVVETVVFVVVLVLLLKSFVAEAFVIPTGSMATTLYGYQKLVECPKCHHTFPVNCSQEVDPQEGERVVITGCTCPNCRQHIELAKEAAVEERDPRTGMRITRQVVQPLDKYSAHTGDRVLVGKFLYDLPWSSPAQHRLNVVVFKYPERPEKDYTPMNYIKRLVGLPGETIGIYYGKIFILSPDKGLRYDDSGVPELDRWQYKYMHANDPAALERWNKKEFEILRKPPEVVLSMRRLVYDNDHPALDLKDWPRWRDWSGGAWAEDAAAHTFKHAPGADLAWVRYQHIIARDGRTKPELITDFIGYNSYEPQPGQPTQHWVGDLMLEADVTVDKPEGEVVFELSRGSQRFRAVFNLESGECTLKQIKNATDADKAPADAGETLDAKPTELKKPGTHHVRFANVDDRLLLWVDHNLPFGDGARYTPAEDRGPIAANDLKPASIGARGVGVTVGKIQLWRDTYYTQMTPRGNGADDADPHVELADPGSDNWGDLHHLTPLTLYVQPGHYLCLGDNSPHSSDGRAWGLVPDRLMLGRALVVYYPFGRVGPIR